MLDAPLPDLRLPDDRPAPLWGAISLSSPFLGFAAGCAVGLTAPHFRWFEWGFAVWIVFAVFGLLSGIVSAARRERLKGIMIAGLILNMLVIVLVVSLWSEV